MGTTMMTNAHPTEVIFLVVVLIALTCNVWGLALALKRRKQIADEGRNGLLKEVAFAVIMNEWFNIVANLLLLYAAVTMVWTAPPPPDLTPRMVWGRVFITAVSGVLMIKTLFARYMRFRVDKLDKRHYSRRHSDRRSD